MNLVETKYKETEIGLIPEEWDVLSVSDVAVVNEKVLSNKNPIDIKYLDIASVEGGKIMSLQNINLSVAPSRARRILNNNDIAISTVRPNLKHYVFIKNAQENLIGSTGFAVVTPKKIDPRFLYFSLTTDLVTEYLSSIAASQTSTYPAINPDTIENLLIAIPSNDEQKQIAEILSSLDDKIELNRQINANLENLASSLFKQWFVDFEFPNEDSKPYKSSGGKMVESELGEIPSAWEIAPMAKVFDFLEGPGIRNWQYAENGTRFINIRLIDGGDIKVQSANYINQEDVETKYQHFLLKENDMVLSASGTLGKSAIVRKSHLPLLLNTSVIRFRPSDGVSYPFLYQYLQSRYFLDEQVRLSAGSVQANFGPTHLAKMSVCLPEEERMLNLFNGICSSIYAQIIFNFDQNEKLSQTRDSILPRLMSGKIRATKK